MKPSVKILAFIFVLFSTFSMAATDPVDKTDPVAPTAATSIKLLPSAQKGSIKVLYVNSQEKKVTVRIHGEIEFTDKIRLSASDKGFIKKYDLSKLNSGTYWIEVEDSSLNLAFEVHIKEDGTVFAEYWKQFMPDKQDPAVASL